MQAALAQIEKNKIDELHATLGQISTEKLEKILTIIEKSRIIQISEIGRALCRERV